MKTELKDYILSTIAIILILTITFSLIYLLRPAIASLHLPIISVLIYVLLFLLVYGIATSFYLKLLNLLIPLKEGSYDMNHLQFILWKHHSVVGEMGKHALRGFFPFFLWPVFYTLFGAKIGKNVAIGGVITDPFLVNIKDFGVIGKDSIVTSHTIVFNKFIMKPITIEKKATIGINAVIMPGVEIRENSIVAPGAVVLMDTKIPPNEFWGGVPAKKIKDIEPIS
jgi:acetyltransferase-like isoleucine patch superfamily enzyme